MDPDSGRALPERRGACYDRSCMKRSSAACMTGLLGQEVCACSVVRLLLANGRIDGTVSIDICQPWVPLGYTGTSVVTMSLCSQFLGLSSTRHGSWQYRSQGRASFVCRPRVMILVASILPRL